MVKEVLLARCGDESMLKRYLREVDKIELGVFPVRGKDIMELGYKGQDVGNLLLVARRLWLDSKCKMTKEELIKALT